MFLSSVNAAAGLTGAAAMLAFTLPALVFSVFASAEVAAQISENSSSAGDATVAPEPTETPAEQVVSGKFDVQMNQRYSDIAGRAGTCDLYLPKTAESDSAEAGDGMGDEASSSGLRAAVLIVHGGAWLTGDKWTTTAYARMLAARGYVVINMNYRLAPAHKFPAQVDDVRQAIIWIRENAKRFRIDVNRIGMFGYSAGAHLSAIVAMAADESTDKQQAASLWANDDPRWKLMPKIRSLCIGGPPCDFRAMPPDNTALSYFLGGSRSEKPGVYDAASPAVYVSASDPPTQIIHGDADLLVPINNSRTMHDRLVSLGVSCQLKTITGQGHMVTFMHRETQSTMLDFFKRTLAE